MSRTEVVNAIINITMQMDEVWRYHPDNPESRDVVEYYNELKKQKEELIELEKQAD